MSDTNPLQLLRSSTANKRPNPAGLADGRPAINTNATSPGLFFKDAGGALVKVGPVHVGTTAPNASPASGGTAGNSVGEQWLDTTGGTYVFKVWDGSAWRSESGTFVDVNGDVMTGALGIIAGSAAAPGLYVSGDTNTGLYSPGADQLALATGGSGRLVVDANGNVLIGTASSTDRFGVQSGLQLSSTTRAGSSISLSMTDSASVESGAIYFWGGQRENADSLGLIQFGGSLPGAGSTNIGATIEAVVDGVTYSGGDNTDLPTRLVFATTPDGGSTPTERLRITSTGQVRLAGAGITFNGDTATANELDDYEEGTFTPTIVGTSTAGTGTYSANGQVGRYTKIGNRVFFDLYLAWTAHTGTGNLEINGLPFTVQNTTNLNRTYSIIFSSLTLTAGSIGAAFSSPNTTTIALRQLPTGGGAVATIPMDTSAQISISGSFDV